MVLRDKPGRSKVTSLAVVEGGRLQLEEILLREFLRPDVDNLARIRELGIRLRPRGHLVAVKPSEGGPASGGDHPT